MALRGMGPGPEVIKLNGLLGCFQIGNSAIKVNYLSTFANPVRGDGHTSLVRELMPMRERISASGMRDLRSLLQRELNDFRVAEDLIPYLQGATGAGVGFFPAILAVMVPKGYLTADTTPPPYPAPEVGTRNGNVFTRYGEYWNVERYSMDGDSGASLPLGMLEIVPSRADIVVLDGQHRANAFRFLSGTDPGSQIYKAFYQNVATQPFDADLPVTLIWFETDGAHPVEPRLISRQLFVDVNNTAKRVSESRTILLNDRAATCIGTQEFYNLVARERGFAPERFSLLHAGLDVETDQARHKLMLTTPEFINTALFWAFFGGANYDTFATEKIIREASQNTSKFNNLFSGFSGAISIATDDDEAIRGRFSRMAFNSMDRAEEFRDTFREKYLPVLLTLMDQFVLLQPHYETCTEIAHWVEVSPSTTRRETWQKVFCGGEGLYWSLKQIKNDVAKDCKDAIVEIETEFSARRIGRFGGAEARRIDDAYDSFFTKAFQTGFLSAVEYLSRNVTSGDYLEAAEQLINGLNRYSLAQWLTVFGPLRQLLFGSGVDPKKWPLYRTLLVRMYDNDTARFFDHGNLADSPDWRVYKALLNQAARGYADTNETPPTDAKDSEVLRLAGAAFATTETLFRDCGLTAPWFNAVTVVDKGANHLYNEIKRYPFS